MTNIRKIFHCKKTTGLLVEDQDEDINLRKRKTKFYLNQRPLMNTMRKHTHTETHGAAMNSGIS